VTNLGINLLKLYIPLMIWVGLGVILGCKLPKAVSYYLGKFLFWIGVPTSIIAFLRQADLSGSVWLAPAIAWAAILTGASLGWLWIQCHPWVFQALSHWRNSPHWLNNLVTPPSQNLQNKPSQGSFLLAAMVGNTGYLGYPITLMLIGPQYFAWALFYDLIGTTLGAYSLGVVLAARFGLSNQNPWQLLQTMLLNPGLLSFGLGLGFRQISLTSSLETGLRTCAWTMIALSLLLMGMRLSQITSWQSIRQAAVSLVIKMLAVPLLFALGISYLSIPAPAQLAILLQMAMPPAFATLVLAEAYELDRELTVTALAMGSVSLLITLPIWLILL
jgi:hypothetical protein